MAMKQGATFPYSSEIKRMMKLFYDSLNEKDKRHYAAVEAKRLPYGGSTYISDLLGCDRTTLQSGIEELEKK